MTIVERLQARKAFGLNGHSWIMLNEPDPDCQEAATKIKRLTALNEKQCSNIALPGRRDRAADGGAL
jgi:hypothetical protein